MPEVLNIRRGEEPSSYSNHVLVEATDAGTYRASGKSNSAGLPEHLLTPHFSDLAKTIEVASAWADEHGVDAVHVVSISH